MAESAPVKVNVGVVPLLAVRIVLCDVRDFATVGAYDCVAVPAIGAEVAFAPEGGGMTRLWRVTAQRWSAGSFADIVCILSVEEVT